MYLKKICENEVCHTEILLQRVLIFDFIYVPKVLRFESPKAKSQNLIKVRFFKERTC